MTIANQAKNSGFLSQRDFNRYMVDFRKENNRHDEIDPVSKDLIDSGKEKGRKGEYIVCGIFKDMGYDARVLSGHDSCDVIVKVNGKWLNVEVKTAALGKSSPQYNFNHIKLKLFDVIALVFVTDEGTTVQIGGYSAKNFIGTWGTCVEGCDDYKLFFGRTRRHCKDRGGEGTWFDMNEDNLKKILVSS